MNRLRIRGLVIVAAMLGVDVVSLSGRAQEGEMPAAPQVDPQADTVIHAMIDHIATLESVSVNGTINMSLNMGGEKRDMTNTYRITLARPNKMAVRGEGSDNAGTAVADGRKLYLHMPSTGKYVVIDQPESFDDVLDDPLTAMMSNGVGGLVGTLWHSQAYDKFMADVIAIEYVGQETLDDQPVHHLRVVQSDGAHHVWITATDTPTMSRIVPDTSQAAASQPGQSVDMKIVIDLADWQSNPTPAEDAFVFTPPAGAAKADDFFEDEQAQPPAEHGLIGTDAPDFTLANLEGNPVKLSDHEGQDIVILDFWATWCGPCVQGMPAVSATAGKYADKNVVLYAVNVQEDVQTIKAFLNDKKWNIKVVQDTDGAVSSDYLVTGIPQTVVIDKQGRVQAVHVGYGPGAEKKLDDELNQLTSGGSLID